MKGVAKLLLVIAVTCCVLPSSMPTEAALTSEQKRELAEIRRNLPKISASIRAKRFDEADKMIKDLEERVKKFASRSRVDLRDRSITSITSVLAKQKHLLAINRDPDATKKARKAGVSFVNHVAKIVEAKCVKCHGDSPKGELKLNSYAGMKKGGSKGPLLMPGNPRASLMMARITTPMSNLRMPKTGSPPLTLAELNVLTMWVAQGARFDGEDQEAELKELIKPKENLPPLKGWEPTGKETVSFKRDLAPWIAKYCLRCHTGTEAEGGLSLESFDSLMRGGKRGKVVVPGRPEESLIYKLVGSFDEQRRMPANRSKLLRKDWENLGYWIHEGAKFDGGEPTILITALNPTKSQSAASQLEGLTPEQFVKFRDTRSIEQWKTMFPDDEPSSVELDDVVFYGNVKAERLDEARAYAEDHLRNLRTLFGPPAEERLWKGRLSFFLLTNRDEFERFNRDVVKRQVFDESFSNVVISSTFEDAFVVTYETGDKTDGAVPSFEFNIIQQLTAAFFASSDTFYPQFLAQGLGPALAVDEVSKRDPYVETLRKNAVLALQTLEKPIDVFKEGVFFSEEQGLPASFSLVDFLIKKGGGHKRLGVFISAIKAGSSTANSIRMVYRSEPELVARNYLGLLKVRLNPKPDPKK